MLVLAIDTCHPRGSVCITQNSATFPVISHDPDEESSSWLLPAIQKALVAEGASFGDLSAIAVASGPGSFTGVRVGLTTVKALCEVYSIPAVPVSRLLAVAHLSSRRAGWIASFVDARRGEVFGAAYLVVEGRLENPSLELAAPVTEFQSEVLRVAGGETVLWASPDEPLLADVRANPNRAGSGDLFEQVGPLLAPAIAEIGLQRLKLGQTADPISLDANYIRRPDAERLWKGLKSAGHAR